jgi:hypothetical protein
MPDFSFDPETTPDQNIKAFFDFLEVTYPEEAALLRTNIRHLRPLPEESAKRSEARVRANKAIEAALDQVPRRSEGEK